MLVRRTLQFALLALVATMALTVLWNIGLIVGEPTLGETITSYFRWGRWADVATLLLFVALLIVTPFLPGTRRAGHIVVAGVAIALVGDLIDLSNLASPDAGIDLTPDGLAAVFTAGRAFGFSTDPTSMYTWAAGIMLMGIGLLILSVDAEDRKWSRISAVLGIAFAVMALIGINVFGTRGVFWIASWIAMGACFSWLVVALNVTTESSGSANWAKKRPSRRSIRRPSSVSQKLNDVDGLR
jgi:hypothetical protein